LDIRNQTIVCRRRGRQLAALLASPRPTLIDLPLLYFDDAFRERVVARVTDPIVARFWRKEFAGYDQRFRAEAAASILNKAGQIAASPVLRNILGQTSPRFDLAHAMDNQKILVANLAKGQMGAGVQSARFFAGVAPSTRRHGA
jgi:hypothetical protein